MTSKYFIQDFWDYWYSLALVVGCSQDMYSLLVQRYRAQKGTKNNHSRPDHMPNVQKPPTKLLAIAALNEDIVHLIEIIGECCSVGNATGLLMKERGHRSRRRKIGIHDIRKVNNTIEMGDGSLQQAISKK
uniref:Uncharacterized protein n=1 Tax=Glossina brevipalpis TaxID=37001 RepID=A0A1A9WCT7_9MUSC